MTFLEFLETYYIWLLVVTVILIITIIGYLADRRDKKKKQVKEELNNTVLDTQANNTGVIENTNMNNINEQLNVQPTVSQMPNNVESAVNVPNPQQQILNGMNNNIAVNMKQPETIISQQPVKPINNIQNINSTPILEQPVIEPINSIVKEEVTPVVTTSMDHLAKYSEPTTVVLPEENIITPPITQPEFDSTIKIPEEPVIPNTQIISEPVQVTPQYEEIKIEPLPTFDFEPANNVASEQSINTQIQSTFPPIVEAPTRQEPINLNVSNEVIQPVTLEEPIIKNENIVMPNLNEQPVMENIIKIPTVEEQSVAVQPQVNIPVENVPVYNQSTIENVATPTINNQNNVFENTNVDTADIIEDDVWKL